MSNKFKIRKLENDKRSIDKEIEKLKFEDFLLYESELLYSVSEEIKHNVKNNVAKEEEFAMMFKNDVEIRKYGDTSIFIINNKHHNIKVKGIAKKHKDDEFDFDKGFKIAEYRARVAFAEEILRLAIEGRI